MPVTRTAKKALRQNVRRHAKNVAQSAELKKTLKAYKKLAESKKLDEATKTLSLVFQKLDKAAKTGLIKKNHANRLKSRLSKRIAVKK
jgi:small subunit ribosomal protein S20